MAGVLTAAGEIDLAATVGRELAQRVRLRMSPKARRMSLRVDAADGMIVLVTPRRAGIAGTETFLRRHVAWIERQLAAIPPATPVAHGSVIDVLGARLTVRHSAGARRGVWREGDVLLVSGNVDHLARRVRDWLIGEAKRELGVVVRDLAQRLGRPITRLSVRDPKTRWGSCNRRGVICLSWRLVLAPRHVSRYVAAHEVAHLQHMNHSAAFWRTVDQLVGDAAPARTWLKANGAALHRIARGEAL